MPIQWYGPWRTFQSGQSPSVVEYCNKDDNHQFDSIFINLSRNNSNRSINDEMNDNDRISSTSCSTISSKSEQEKLAKSRLLFSIIVYCCSVLLLLLAASIVAYFVIIKSNNDQKLSSVFEENDQNMTVEEKLFLTGINKHSSAHQQSANNYQHVRSMLHRYYQIEADKYSLINSAKLITDQVDFDDGTELSRNRRIEHDLYQGDIVLTVDQAKYFLQSQTIDNNRHRRKVINEIDIDGRPLWWKNSTIYYKIDQAFSDSQAKNIRIGLDLWQNETCLIFNEITNDDDTIIDDFIYFYQGYGCYSNIGRTGGMQPISIGIECDLPSIVAHEVAHTLGFLHEQSRFDRDRYIRVELNSVDPTNYGQFAKTDAMIDFNVPYDYGSLMHYGKNAFSLDPAYYTIRPTDHNYINTIGQRQRPSFSDVRQMNNIYCKETCLNNEQLQCLNDGYQDPTNCSQCRCPTGFVGLHCENIASTQCGGDLIATIEWKTLIGDARNCTWRITATNNSSRIRFEITEINYKCDNPCESFLEIKYGDNYLSTGFRLCNCADTLLTGKLLSATNSIIIQSKNSFDTVSSRFSLRYIEEKIEKDFVNNDSNLIATTNLAGIWSECTAICGACGRQTFTSFGQLPITYTCARLPCRTVDELSPPAQLENIYPFLSSSINNRLCSGVLRQPCQLMIRLMPPHFYQFNNNYDPNRPQIVLDSATIEHCTFYGTERFSRQTNENITSRNRRDICEQHFTYECGTEHYPLLNVYFTQIWPQQPSPPYGTRLKRRHSVNEENVELGRFCCSGFSLDQYGFCS